jgi:hypothetical protein
MKPARRALSLIPRSVRASLILLVAVASAGLGLAVSASASPAHPARAATVSAAPQTVVLDCPGESGQVKPKDFILTCADGYTYLDKLAWTSWTPALASASGSLVENDCVPNCVAGHFHRYPVLVVLWRRIEVTNASFEHCYSRMTLIYTGRRPLHVPPTQTIPLLTSLPTP